MAAFGPSPEQLREEAAKAEQLAKESGTPAKSAVVIRQLERRWREFLDANGMRRISGGIPTMVFVGICGYLWLFF